MDKGKQLIHQWVWLLLPAFCLLGLFFPAIGMIAIGCMIAPIIMAFFKGRRWCGVYCPRGSFNDIILSKISMKRRAPALLRKSWFKLFFLILLMGAFGFQLIMARENINNIGEVFVRMVIITTLFTIALGIIYNQRTWCLICPMGTMAHYVAKTKTIENRIEHVTFDKDKCIHCKVCSRNCPIAIDVYGHWKAGKVIDANCIKCMTCVGKCPKKSLYVA